MSTWEIVLVFVLVILVVINVRFTIIRAHSPNAGLSKKGLTALIIIVIALLVFSYITQ